MGSEKNGRLQWWIMATAVSIVLLGTGYFLSNLHSEITRINTIQQDRGERITALETQMLIVGPRLQRIEEKLDNMREEVVKMRRRP